MKAFRNAAAASELLRLRRQLMLAIFTVVTLVMVVLSILLLSLAEKQLGQATWHYLDIGMDSLLAHLDTEGIISNQWLAQQERSNQALIFLSDGGKPLQFQGIWPTETTRSILLERAQKQARAQGLELTIRPMLPSRNGSCQLSIERRSWRPISGTSCNSILQQRLADRYHDEGSAAGAAIDHFGR